MVTSDRRAIDKVETSNQKRCLYCEQALSFAKRVLNKRFCCRDHRDLYTQEQDDRAGAGLQPQATIARFLAQVEAERNYFQEILDRAPVPIAVVSKDLAIHYANRSFRHRCDYRGTPSPADPNLCASLLALLETLYDGEADLVAEVLQLGPGSTEPFQRVSAARLPPRHDGPEALLVIEHLEDEAHD